ncbi:uncharacterized protein BdWA1_003562 [Babesia duncani]|uniref:Uncharacterized protein n=2 Tax=Babesia duncani TaxID=323732 RepID=A0AAD9PHV4_9APIC|nr:hypothetical protein BdWA1_003562 [Babesia duncani]
MVSGVPNLYNRKFDGKLKLKGSAKIAIGKQHKSKGTSTRQYDSNEGDDHSTNILGTGRIVSSGKTVQGYVTCGDCIYKILLFALNKSSFETKFLEEAAVGDFILVKHPMTLINEEKQIESILSNRTLYIDDAFSSDLISTMQFSLSKSSKILFYISPGKIGPQEEAESSNSSTKNIKTHSTITVREKAGMWSYKTVTKFVKNAPTAEERLNERIKMGRDKYCW